MIILFFVEAKDNKRWCCWTWLALWVFDFIVSL